MKKSSFSEIERHAPNHALQRTAPHVTAAASGLRLSAAYSRRAVLRSR